MSIRELDMDEGEEILPSSDMHFNPRLELKATAFLDSLLGKLTEAENKKRVRATEMKRRILSCILANVVKSKGSQVIVLVGKTKKYGDFSQDILIRMITGMVALGWIDLLSGDWKTKKASTIVVNRLDLSGLEYMSGAKEAVIVRKKGKQVNSEPYFDQKEIDRMKSEVCELNEWLKQANLIWEGASSDCPDLSNREIQRIFNVYEGMSEEYAREDYVGFGRLYGAFWIGMKKCLRPFLRIEGENCALIDFSSMNVNLAYFFAGELPPTDEDLYDLTGLLCGFEKTPEWRKAVKKFVSSIWFCKNKTMPHGIWIPNQKLKYQDIWFAVLRRHPKLRSVLSTRNIGYRMAWFEGDSLGRGRRPPDFRRLGKGSLGRGRGAKSNGSLL